MKAGDLVEYISSYVPITHPTGIIIAVGHDGRFTDTEQSRCLHPDIWVFTSEGVTERWNEKYARVINESR